MIMHHRESLSSVSSTRSAALLVLVLLSAGTVGDAQTADAQWSQWGGPGRDFRADSARIGETWPATGPTELWRRSLGEGYSSIVVDNEIIVTMYREAEREVIVALAAHSGETVWQYGYEAPLVRDGYFDVWLNAAGPGPYSTPLIANGIVFAVGVNGQFHALDLRTGVVRWSRDLVSELELVNYNAFASSPLAYEQTVILPLGGGSGGVAAFDRETGSVVWRSDPLAAAPASPVLVDLDGETQLVVLGQQLVVGLDPHDGRQLWSHPHPNELGLNLSTPVWDTNNRLFVSSAYDGGSRMIQLFRGGETTSVRELWSTNRMRLHFGNALRVGDLLIGSSGDFGPAFLTAVHVDTGEEAWRERGFARAHLIDAGGRLLIVDEDGDVAIGTASDRGLKVHARHTVLSQNAWTPPTLVGTSLYLRDREDIVALDLAP